MVKTKYQTTDDVLGKERDSFSRKGSKLSEFMLGTGVGKAITIGTLAASIFAVGAFYQAKTSEPKYVKVPVSTDVFWDVYTSRDKDGDIFASSNDWQGTLTDTYVANDVRNAKELSQKMRKDGYLSVPKDRINPKYNF